MLGLEAYRDMFGLPYQGFHAVRIPGLDVALYDTFGTIVIAVIVAYLFDWTVWKTVLGAFALAILMHALFKVHTKLTVALGLV
jgi:hypothetical protein